MALQSVLEGARCFSRSVKDSFVEEEPPKYSLVDEEPPQYFLAEEEPPEYRPVVLTSDQGSYERMTLLGEGAFGLVWKCENTDTNQTVAMKILKVADGHNTGADREVEILERLQCFDPDKYNYVRFFHCFTFGGIHCLAFEMLHMSLRDFMSHSQSLSLDEIRPVVQQVATALQMLKRAGIIHTDLKPDNIMLVDDHHEPLRVKVIDFGNACSTSEVKCGSYVQTRWYRSPEILLGLSFTEAIDMWSLGCVAAELFLGALLYPGCSEYDMMRFISQTQGPPPDPLLHASTKTDQYFTTDLMGLCRLKTPMEARVQSRGTRRYNLCSLDAIKDIHLSKELKGEDLNHFVDLLKQMLQMDPCKRIEPDQVLQHPFVMDVCRTQRTTSAPTIL